MQQAASNDGSSLDGLWVLLVSDDRQPGQQIPMMARAGNDQTYLLGFKNVRNLAGGILGWIDQVDPSQPKY